MKYFFIIISLAIGINVTAQGQDFLTLKNNLYTFQYPANWSVDTSNAMGTEFIIFSPLESSGDKFRENVNLFVQDLGAQNLNLDEYTKISEEQIKTLVLDGEIVSSERLIKETKEYQKIIYSFKTDLFVFKVMQYYFIKNNKAYLLTLTTEIENFDNYLQIGEKSLNSFLLL